MKILLLLLSLFSCSAEASKKGGDLKVCIIKQNGILVEKRYFDPKGEISGIVTYSKDGMNPKDSVSFNGQITTYNYEEGRYSVNKLSLVRDYYTQVYSVDSICPFFKLIRHRFLIEEVISNLCVLQGSVLSDGTEVATKAEIVNALNEVTIKYPKLNSVFNNLPEVIQSYFYNKPLVSLELSINDGYLQKETYSFSEGTALRHFIYDNNELKKWTLEIKYLSNKNGPEKISRTYELK